jgi:hypothetical protein
MIGVILEDKFPDGRAAVLRRPVVLEVSLERLPKVIPGMPNQTTSWRLGSAPRQAGWPLLQP